MGFEGEREGNEDVINPKRERIALCAREANVRSHTVHPKGEAFLAGGLEVPREESFQGDSGESREGEGGNRKPPALSGPTGGACSLGETYNYNKLC